jgi:hypothetical protein
MTEHALAAWSDALPAVLALMDERQRGMFRQELQRFLATSRFSPDSAGEVAGLLRELLLQSARASRRPAAVHATRELPDGAGPMVELCEGILASWRDAEAAAADAGPCEDGADGVFFGPRLGGSGRPGARRRADAPEDQD